MGGTSESDESFDVAALPDLALLPLQHMLIDAERPVIPTLPRVVIAGLVGEYQGDVLTGAKEFSTVLKPLNEIPNVVSLVARRHADHHSTHAIGAYESRRLRGTAARLHNSSA